MEWTPPSHGVTMRQEDTHAGDKPSDVTHVQHEGSELAWRSFAWFMSEPDHIMVLHRGDDADRALLSELMRG